MLTAYAAYSDVMMREMLLGMAYNFVNKISI